jgi:alpha-L-rhamnosidase
MKHILRSLYPVTLAIFVLSNTFVGCKSIRKTTVSDLKCEYAENPSGMDILKPRFSWNLTGVSRGIFQSAYRIIVTDNKVSLMKKTGNIWDSGKVPSDKMINVEYSGAPLKSDQTYYWSVCIWDKEGEHGIWSKPAYFHTALFDVNDWKAQWITADSTIDAPLFRKEFEINRKVKSAYVFVTGLGYYELYLNGRKIGDHVLDPAITNYRKHILYATYDVTDQLKSGRNAAGALLGNGAFRLKKVKSRYCWETVSPIFGTPRLLMQLNITYSDGTMESVVSDNSWKYSASPITYNDVYGGEDYDGRLEKEGWSSPGFDESGWKQAVQAESPGGALISQTMPPIKVTATITPVAQTNPEPGVYLFDMGQNLPGWWRVRVKGPAGVTMRIRGAETLNDSLFPKPLGTGDHLSIKQRYHAGVWTDYTLTGKGTEIYEPRFFYTGYRYVEVTMNNHVNPELLEIEGRVVHSALERNGVFTTSDSLLNRINRASIWSQIGNTHGFPTDCPHREKGGYTGDGEIIAESSIHDFQMAAFYTKWLNDMRDAQEENGRIPNTSPTLIGGHGGGIAWGSAYILLPFWMYRYYNDTRVLEDHYATMKRYIEYLRNLARTDSDPKEPYIINAFGGYWYSLGEWCAPGQSDCPNHPVVNTYYYYQNALLFSRIADLLGRKDDAGRYLALSDTIKNEFNKKFFNPVTNLYGTDYVYQTYQLLALAGKIIPEGHSGQVFRTVINDITDTRQGHLNTGIIGTKYLWYVMAHADRNDISYTVATRTTYPGYGYWLKNGATTLLEEWSGKNSHNHQMFGSVDEFFFKYLAGIRAPTDSLTTAGYKHIHIQPFVPEGLSFTEASVKTAAGVIGSHWHHTPDFFRLKVEIPANCDASVNIPILDFRNAIITEHGKKVWENGRYAGGVRGITGATTVSNLVSFSTGSGVYDFKLTGK